MQYRTDGDYLIVGLGTLKVDIFTSELVAGVVFPPEMTQSPSFQIRRMQKLIAY